MILRIPVHFTRLIDECHGEDEWLAAQIQFLFVSNRSNAECRNGEMGMTLDGMDGFMGIAGYSDG